MITHWILILLSKVIVVHQLFSSADAKNVHSSQQWNTWKTSFLAAKVLVLLKQLYGGNKTGKLGGSCLFKTGLLLTEVYRFRHGLQALIVAGHSEGGGVSFRLNSN